MYSLFTGLVRREKKEDAPFLCKMGPSGNTPHLTAHLPLDVSFPASKQRFTSTVTWELTWRRGQPTTHPPSPRPRGLVFKRTQEALGGKVELGGPSRADSGSRAHAGPMSRRREASGCVLPSTQRRPQPPRRVCVTTKPPLHTRYKWSVGWTLGKSQQLLRKQDHVSSPI